MKSVHIMVAYNFLIIACLVSFVRGVELIINAVSKDIKCNLKSINAIVKPKRNRLELAKHLMDFIQIHSNSKQLSTHKPYALQPVFYLLILTF